ncbi:flavin-containing monooxygenase [Dankookia sp. P2]|uniref:flavin-containing monooxygenase n=1 Tax=Dankookia sp. P2 TaxID=3423955 RepID=UPI003D663FCA
MPDLPMPVAAPVAAQPTGLDAIVIGAGIAGMYQLYRLRQLGLTVRVFEAGTGVGGTWYWNRYPGARFDPESYTYGYAFDEALLQDWNWSEHFAAQPETLRYLNHVADRFDLRRDIRFEARVARAQFDEATREWEVALEGGERHRARMLITAIGPLSAATLPRIPGIGEFRGTSFHTYRWPHDPVDFTGKRVAVIGTGATGVQVIQTIAPQVGQLTVFQRTPNWCTPLHNAPDHRGGAGAHQGQLPADVPSCCGGPPAATSTIPTRAGPSR